VSGTDSRPPAEPPDEQDTVTQLKEQIASRRYRVDSQAVAREMLFKIKMLALVRARTQPRS
jgi:anti-sigma28 factor (negative regulator of flagellin synthesis)